MLEQVNHELETADSAIIHRKVDDDPWNIYFEYLCKNSKEIQTK